MHEQASEDLIGNDYRKILQESLHLRVVLYNSRSAATMRHAIESSIPPDPCV
jgi:hypothetical protein